MSEDNVIFIKRMDLWRSYRDEIIKNSLKLEGIFNNNDKKISKIINNINTIDKSILAGLDSKKIELAETFVINKDIDTEYKGLKLNIIDINNNNIEQMENEIKYVEMSKKEMFLIDDNGNIKEEKILLDNHKLLLNNIENKMKEVKEKIQVFPQNANNDLKKLSQVLVNIQKKGIDSNIEDLVQEKNINNSFIFKKTYFIFIIGFTSCIIIALILIIVQIFIGL